MAAPKKDIRKISVNGTEYTWQAIGEDGVVVLDIRIPDSSAYLTAIFHYHHNLIPIFQPDGSVSSWNHRQRLAISSGHARRVIEYGLQHGWQPQEGQLHLGHMDGLIDLNLKPEIKYPELQSGQVALHFAELGRGRALSKAQDQSVLEKGIYFTFCSLQEAREFASQSVALAPEIECWITTAKDKAVYYVGAQEEKAFFEL